MALHITVGVIGLVAFLAGTALFVSKPVQPSVQEAVGPAGILERRLQHVRGRDPAQEITLHTSAGHLYRDQGLYSKAAEHYDAAKLLAVQSGSDRLVATLRDAAITDFHRGHLLQAQRSLEEALEFSGETGEDAAAVLRALGNVRRERGQLDEALETYARAWDAAQASGAPGTEQMLAALEAEIGEAHARRGDLASAGEHLRAAVRLQEQLGSSLGPSQSARLDLATARTSLGSVHQWQGDVPRALELYEQALQTQTALRADHPELVSTHLGQARALRDGGRRADALQAMESLEEALRRGPLEGPDLSRVLVARADALRENGAFEEAVAAATEARALQSEAFGEDANPEVAAAHNVLGSVLHDQGLVADAQQQYLLALDASLRAGGELHPETAAAHNSLGTASADAGDDDAAEAHFRACLKIQQQTMPADSANIATSYNNLATVLYRRGARLEASELLQRALAVMDRAKVPAMNPERRFYEHSLQQVTQELEKSQLLESPGGDDVEEAAHSVVASADAEPISFAIV